MIRMLAAAMVTAVLVSACDGHPVAFRPVLRQGDRLAVSDEPLDSRMHDNVIHVLRFYGVEFREGASGAIVIPKAVASDLDTIWNYTTKANDETWLREHPSGRAE